MNLTYRDRIHYNNRTVTHEDVDEENEFIHVNIVQDIIDDIEQDVIEIRDKLEEIEGLSEIEEIKDLVRKLAKQLY